jgi:hypothetical protein
MGIPQVFSATTGVQGSFTPGLGRFEQRRIRSGSGADGCHGDGLRDRSNLLVLAEPGMAIEQGNV